MHTETITAPVVTFAAAEVLGGGETAAQPDRDQVRAEVERTVRDAMQAAQEGAQAGRAAADQARMEADVARAREAVAQLQGPTGANVSITRQGPNFVIRGADGKMVTVDESLMNPDMIRELTATLAHAPPPPPPFEQGPPENVIKLTALIFTFITIMVLGVAWARAFARRGAGRTAPSGGMSPDVPLRLERIEQAVDAMAVEMERVSEAQRYAARLLTERLPESAPQLAGARSAHAAGQSRP